MQKGVSGVEAEPGSRIRTLQMKPRISIGSDETIVLDSCSLMFHPEGERVSKKKKKNKKKNSCTVKGKIVQIRKKYTRFCIAYTSLQNTARTALDSVSHAITDAFSCNMSVQFMDAYPAIGECNGRLSSKRRVLFTDAYPVISGCNSRSLSSNRIVHFTAAYPEIGECNLQTLTQK